MKSPRICKLRILRVVKFSFRGKLQYLGSKVQALAAALRSLSKHHNTVVNMIEVAKSSCLSDTKQPKSSEQSDIIYPSLLCASVQCAALATCALRQSSTLSCMLEAQLRKNCGSSGATELMPRVWERSPRVALWVTACSNQPHGTQAYKIRSHSFSL